jgi:predicted phosphoribosyltransferase
MVFEDRRDAGIKLAAALKKFKGKKDVLLFALPRGGVVLGAEVAKALGLPFDVIVTRKIGASSNPEYAIGALSETGEIIWNENERAVTDKKELNKIVKAEKAEAVRRIKKYRKGKVLPDMAGKTAVIIDDGVATGLTIRAAVAAAKAKKAKRVVIAVPHGARDSLMLLRREADEVVALDEPEWYGAVGQFYKSFPQTEDEEVLGLLKQYGPK